MSRSKRRARLRAWGLLRSVADRKLVTAEVRAGRCPCNHPDIDNPGEHIPACWLWRDPDAPDSDLPF